MKSHFRHREEEEEILPLPSTRESIIRRIYIRREDVSDSSMDSPWAAKDAKQPTGEALVSTMKHAD